MIKTTEYFEMSEQNLLEIRNEHNYTREECKILDDGVKVAFFNNIKSYKEQIDGYQEFVKSRNEDLELKATLLMCDKRVAVVYC